jgi:HPt (histidine-containing phosphotransfer) domain-containing protein
MKSEDIPFFDDRQLSRVLESDEPAVLRSFYELFLQQLKEMQQALLLHEQLIDVADLCLLAHKFKSSARAVGATRLGEQMETLEAICMRQPPVGIEAQIVTLQHTGENTSAAIRAWLHECFPADIGLSRIS